MVVVSSLSAVFVKLECEVQESEELKKMEYDADLP